MGVDVRDWYERYGPMVQRRCRGLLHDEQEAFEVTQDVFVEVLRRTDLDVDAPSSFRRAMTASLPDCQAKMLR